MLFSRPPNKAKTKPRRPIRTHWIRIFLFPYVNFSQNNRPTSSPPTTMSEATATRLQRSNFLDVKKGRLITSAALSVCKGGFNIQCDADKTQPLKPPGNKFRRDT